MVVLILFLLIIIIVPWLTAPVTPESQTPFSSERERRLWLWTLVVVAAIYASAGVADTVVAALRERNLLRITYGIVLIVVVGFIIRPWIRQRPRRAEIGVALGIVAVYLMAWIRIHTWEERTHLFEYSVVAILIYLALSERGRSGRRVPVPAIFAVVITTLLGWIDEGIQLLHPNRYYDIRDVGFNFVAAVIAISATQALTWIRSRSNRKTKKHQDP